MKKLSILFSMILCFSFSIPVLAQVQIKGTGNTSATKTWFTSNTNPDTTVVILDNGNVGIGTTSPASRLEVNGVINTTSGGVKFPDGTTQTTAYLGSSVSYQNVFTVAKTGGDFTTITGALGACASTGPTNGYLIRVMPGVYNENVNCLQYIHLKGGGKYTTIINGVVYGADSCVIEDFYIKQGVSCTNVSPTILHNIITNINEQGNGIEISNGGKPWIIENEILDCYGWGIYTHAQGSNPWIYGNKVLRNISGGIKCENTSPAISNNFIFNNHLYGIHLSGGDAAYANPVINDNIIGSSDYTTGGIGIYMTNFAEPRVIANDIYQCEFGIWIDPNAQPSILGNDISYNFEAGIVCSSNGIGKPVVIKSNHIHSNVQPNSSTHQAGIYVNNASPIITHNNIQNNPNSGTGSDINYSSCTSSYPMISLNVFDIISKSSPTTATGLYNVTSTGAAITP